MREGGRRRTRVTRAEVSPPCYPLCVCLSQNVLAGKDAKRIIKIYNKVARTLVAFEYLWYQAWVQSIDQAKAGLQVGTTTASNTP